ncbi:MAG: family 10 glycosylhydrolase, partial [Anaerolineae bacterium]
AIRFGGGLGSIERGEPASTSGRPRWEEAAKYWAQYQGAPPEVHTYDVVSRPLYAEWETAKGYPGEAENAVYVSWHTNGYNGTLRGTESYIHNTEPTAGSATLQDWLHVELISDLRAAWDSSWTDRGQKSADFGELRELSTIPGVLLEIAFHDSPADADALREPVFRQIAARAVYQGIVKYHAERQSAPIRLLPEPPQRLAARNTTPGEVSLTWAPPPCCDGLVGDAAASYKVYHSTSGRGFDNGIEVTEPSLTLTGLPPGSLHFFRVTALNEGGESLPTPVVALRTPAGGQAVDLLVVDGFDRLDQSAMIPQYEAPFLGTVQRMFLERMNRYDHAVEHGQALSACGLAFDGAVNEAIEAGTVWLDSYPAVDWFTGEDSVADASLSEAERLSLAAYLDGGGRLLISGAEIGYDLVEYGRDSDFYREYLHAEYQGDDAGTYQFAGVPGSILDGLDGSFDDGTDGAYDVGYPDRLASAAGSNTILEYVGGLGGGAAVAYAAETGSRVVHFGFPLETVTDPATRAELFCRASAFLLDGTGEAPGGRPRIINPGFEQGSDPSAWQTKASSSDPIFYQRPDLPANVEPHGGEWLAWLGGYTPGISTTTVLTQVVGLPSGEPTATLSLAWFVQVEGTPPPNGDRLSVTIHDLSGTVQADLLTLTNQSPTSAWQTSDFDLSAFSSEIVQIVVRAISTDTAFFVDDVNLTTTGPAGPDEFRALWADAYHTGIKSRQQIDELVETALTGNFNALVVQVRRRGDTYYPSTIDPWAPDATPGFDALAYLIERAHAAGIEVHAWATTLAIWGGDTAPAAAQHTYNLHGPGATGRDYWLMTSQSGGEKASNVYYLDPGHPDVVDYTVAVYAELATHYELDGLHLDRVRYAWQDWGYNPTALARFQTQTGRNDVPEPADPEWLQWRRDQVTALVRRIYLTVSALDPQIRLSGALSAAGWPPTATYPWETRTPYTHQLQDWRSWLEEGILDLGMPMTYKREYESDQKNQFNGWIEWEKDHQYGRGVAIGTALYLNSV